MTAQCSLGPHNVTAGICTISTKENRDWNGKSHLCELTCRKLLSASHLSPDLLVAIRVNLLVSVVSLHDHRVMWCYQRFSHANFPFDGTLTDAKGGSTMVQFACVHTCPDNCPHYSGYTRPDSTRGQSGLIDSHYLSI